MDVIPEKHQGPNVVTLINDICNRMEITTMMAYGRSGNDLIGALDVDHEIKVQPFDYGSQGGKLAEMVACVDKINNELPLDDFEQYAATVVFSRFSTAKKGLEYWLPKITSRFHLHSLQETDEDEYFFIGYAYSGEEH